jgi:hypothetical protein
MSITTIPREYYDILFKSSITYWLDHGMDLIAARNQAQAQMDNAFVPDDIVDLQDAERDAAEGNTYA